jgi:hypothetical protein
LREGLFCFLGAAARERIVEHREAWLTKRAERLNYLAANMQLGEWGAKVVAFLRKQVDAERKWTSELREGAQGQGRVRSRI